MKLKIFSQLNTQSLLTISVVINLILIVVIFRQYENSHNKVLGSKNHHPPITSNEDFLGEKSHFTYSPNRKLIAFVQNVFDEYGKDWDKYWALKVYNLETKEEKELVIDNSKMSSYRWLDNENIKLHHSGGTGVRIFLKTSVNRKIPLFTKDYEAITLWTPDINYSEKVKDNLEAKRIYYKRAGLTPE